MDKLEHKFLNVAFGSQIKGELSGYASLFGDPDWSKDVVMEGAFTESLRTRYPIMFYEHTHSQPVGYWSNVIEDKKGLLVSGSLYKKTEIGAEILDLVKEGEVTGLSIGFKTLESTVDPNTGGRLLKKLDLYEISIVRRPMLSSARVDSIKSLSGKIDVDRILREALARIKTTTQLMKEQ